MYRERRPIFIRCAIAAVAALSSGLCTILKGLEGSVASVGRVDRKYHSARAMCTLRTITPQGLGAVDGYLVLGETTGKAGLDELIARIEPRTKWLARSIERALSYGVILRRKCEQNFVPNVCLDVRRFEREASISDENGMGRSSA